MAIADTKMERGPEAERAAVSSPTSVVGRAAELSEEVLESVEAGQRAAIEAVRTFVGTVEHALPEDQSRRQGIIDSALEMADRLVHTQYDFIRKVIDSAGKSL
jgi:hypothetical protein